MPDERLTIADFAAKVKEKHPDYADVPDAELTARIIKQYPDYKSVVERPTTPNLDTLTSFAKSEGLRIIGNPTGGRHNKGSLHYSGNAVDFDHQGVDFATLKEHAFQNGIILRDERKHPPGQKVWGGPHGHLEFVGSVSKGDTVTKSDTPSVTKSYTSAPTVQTDTIPEDMAADPMARRPRSMEKPEAEPIGYLGEIRKRSPEYEARFYDFVKENAPATTGAKTVGQAAADQTMAQTFLKITDFLEQNPDADEKTTVRGLAQIGGEFLKDPATKGAVLPKALHSAMLAARYEPEEWNELPPKLQNQIRQYRVQQAVARGKAKEVQQIQADIQTLGPTFQDWIPDLEYHLRMKPEEFQSLTKSQQRKVISLVAYRVREDAKRREQGLPVEAPSVEHEIELRKIAGLSRRPPQALNIGKAGTQPRRAPTFDWSDLVFSSHTPATVAAVQRTATRRLEQNIPPEDQSARLEKEIRPQVIKDYFAMGAGVRQDIPAEVAEQQIAGDPRLREYVETETKRRAGELVKRAERVTQVEKGVAPPLGVIDKIRQLRDKPEQLIPFLSSIPEIDNLLKAGQSVEKLDRGESLTEEEIVRLRELNVAAKQDKTFLYQVAETVSALPAFVGEFAATGGVYSAARKGAVKGLEKIVKKGALESIEKTLGGRLAVKAGTSLVGAAAQTIPAGATRIPAGILYRKEEGADFATALRDTVADQFIEVASERTGGVLKHIPLPKRLAAIRDAITERWISRVPGRTAKQLEKIVEATGWHGPVGEIFEERVGDVARYGIGLQESPMPSLKQLAVEGVAFTTPGVAMMGATRLGGKDAGTRTVQREGRRTDTGDQGSLDAGRPVGERGGAPSVRPSSQPAEAQEVKALPRPEVERRQVEREEGAEVFTPERRAEIQQQILNADPVDIDNMRRMLAGAMERVAAPEVAKPATELERKSAIAAEQVAKIRPEVREAADEYLDEIGEDITKITSGADTRQHRDLTGEAAEEIASRLSEKGVEVSETEITDALYALRHEALPEEIELPRTAAKPVEAEEKIDWADPDWRSKHNQRELQKVITQTMFHGTSGEFGGFQAGQRKSGRKLLHGEGVWFAPRSGLDLEESLGFYGGVSDAITYAGQEGRIIEARLSLKNPYFGSVDEIASKGIDAKWLRDRGHDGFVDTFSGSGMVVVLDPSQITEVNRYHVSGGKRSEVPEPVEQGEGEKLPERGLRDVADRIVNAENAFVEFAQETGGLTREQAETALASYKKNKAIKIDKIGGQFTFTHGGFAERDVLRRAAGLEEAAPTRPAESAPKPKRRAKSQRDLSLSEHLRSIGGYVPDYDTRGETERLRRKDTNTTGLINKNNIVNGRKFTADMAMEAANEAGYGPFDNVGDYLYAVERDVAAIKDPSMMRERQWSRLIEYDDAEIERQMQEYYAKQEADYLAEEPRLQAKERREAFLTSGRGAELFDLITEGKANEADHAEYIAVARDHGISETEARAIIDAAAEAGEDFPTEMENISPSLVQARPAEQIGFTQEGLTQESAALPPKQTDQRERLRREEEERQRSLDPVRASALDTLAELRRKGMTVDDYERQGSLIGEAPSAEKLKLLRELESGQQPVSPQGDLIEERFSGLPILRSLFSPRPRNVTVTGPLTSEIPEIEARWQAAKGIKSTSIVKRAIDALKSGVHSFQRHFPLLDPKKNSQTAITVDTLRQYESAPEWAKAVAMDQLAEITGNLDAKAVDVMTRMIALPDILKDIEQGKYTGRDLPFGYENEAAVEADVAKFQAVVRDNPAIQEALSKREAIHRRLANTLVSEGLMSPKILEDERYYHRQVMDYFREMDPNYIGTGSSDVRLKRKGFQIGRVGGGDFNTRYQEAEFEWMAQAYSLIARKQTLDRVRQVNDIRPALWDQAQLLKEETGRDVRWQDLMPEGYRIWQPERGTHFFHALTITERTMDKILSGEKDFEEADVRRMLVMGGPKQQWVIPTELAQTLDNFGQRGTERILEKVWVGAQSGWKQWVLLNPKRIIKYNLNNQSGDLDIVIAYDPAILKEAWRAGKDLWRYHISDKATPAVRQEIQDAIKKGVVGTGMTTSEIPDINKAGPFQLLVNDSVNPFSQAVLSYWRGVKAFTNWRENVLRLAAYRHFQKSEDINDLYGVSDVKSLKGVTGDDRAAKLARELLGDYGNISDAGQWLRRHMIPFYSWIEINTPRYYRLLKNLPLEEGGAGRAGRSAVAVTGRTAWGAAKTLAKAHALYALVILWNYTMFPDDEKKLRREGDKLHLILGHNQDGSLRSIRFQGALSDALEWFSLEDYPYDVAEIAAGRKTGKDMAAEAVKAPAEKLIGAYEPFSKTLFEEVTGRSSYPKLFEKGSSFKIRVNPIRDRKEHMARLFSLDGLYRMVTSKPSPPVSTEMPWSLLDMGVTYRTDPNEAAYWHVRGKVAEYAKSKGKEEGSVADPTERQNALYYFKKATQWGDKDSAKYWLSEYQRLGGTEKGMTQSLRLSHPLGAMGRKYWDEYRATLSAEEKAELEQAEQWYERVFNYKPEPITVKDRRRWRTEERRKRREMKRATPVTEGRYRVQAP
jgi:hypothetical protein